MSLLRWTMSSMGVTKRQEGDDEEDANMQNALEEHAELLRPKQRAPVGGYPDEGDGCSKCVYQEGVGHSWRGKLYQGCRWCPR